MQIPQQYAINLVALFRRAVRPSLIALTLFLTWGCDSQESRRKQPPAPKSEVAEVMSPVEFPKPRAVDWHMFMHDLDFSGISADKTLTPPLQLLWKFKTGGPLHASPVVANGVLYIGSTDGKLYALNAKRWDIKWVFNAGSAIRYSATVLGARVYFSARNNKVYALNADTGEPVWEFKSKSWMDAPPIVVDGKLYIGAFPSKIYQLNAITGKLEATRERTVRIRGVEYGCANGEFRPIAPHYNAPLWRKQTAGSNSYPIIANGFVYIGARDGHIHAFDAASKRETWTYQTRGFIDAAPAVSDGILYAASGDGTVYAFSNVSTTPASKLANGKAPPTPAGARSKRAKGTVTHDNAPVHAARNGQTEKPLLHLNDGVVLPIVQTADRWYEVALPNGELGWMDTFAFGQFEETEGVLFNTNFCGKPRTLQLVEGAEYPRWSPDGELIAMLKRTELRGRYWQASELLIMDKATERARKLYAGPIYNPHVSWSLDSRLLACEVDEKGERYVYTIDWKLGRVKKLIQGDGPTWSPTSNRLVFRRRDKGMDVVYRINSDGSGTQAIARVPVERRKQSYTYLPAPSWAPDGTRVAFGVHHQKYVGIRIQGVEGKRLKEIPTQHQHVAHLHWAADGTQLAYVLSGSNRPGQLIDKQLHLADAISTSTQTQILKHTSPAWAPAGKQLAYLEREDCEGLRWKVWIYDVESGRKCPIARTQLKVTSVVWMPDGEHLCLWHTSDYLRDNAYKPAITKGWIVPVNIPKILTSNKPKSGL